MAAITRRALALGALVAAPAAWAQTPAPSDQLVRAAREAVGDAACSLARARAIVAWTHRRLRWTDTDYQSRTADEILRRGGGNCYEQAVLVRALFREAGVPVRMTAEVNVQPASEERQHDAEARIAEVGPRASVFGRRHNDHRWLEAWDDAGRDWAPCDPTLNVVGHAEWSSARLGFGARPVHDVIRYVDMLFPIAVFVVEGDTYRSRSRRYLVDDFARATPGVSRSPAWPAWRRQIARADAQLQAAFSGRYDFHRSAPLIEDLAATYEALRRSVA